ncbi:MAG: leukotoxin LktA family filamentous adhesin [Negativicutes bacterium]|nr:leukotoxin LktA family filamentous adhesin [Negativicutes bacterium]
MQRKWRRAWRRGKPKFMRYDMRKKRLGILAKKASIPNFVRKFVTPAIAASILIATLGTASAQIVADGKTQTSVATTGNVTNISTATVRGINAFNSFSKFSTDTGTITNLYLPSGTSNLLNLVHNETSYINGIMNSIQNNKVGGNLFFLNPYGVVVGASGAINVGSLSIITPPKSFMDGFFDSLGNPSQTSTQMVLDGSVPVSGSGLITVQGKINAVKDIHLAAGTVANSGVIATGAVFTPKTVDFSDVVNANGYQSGTTIVVENGSISIMATGNVENSGVIVVNGGNNLKAGNVSINAGGDVKLNDGSVVSARGYGQNSSGGQVDIYAQNNATLTNAAIDARGGGVSGDGGSIHFSAKNQVSIQGGTMTAGAVNGQVGMVLIDPATINWTGSTHDVFQTDGTSYTLLADDSITLTDVVISTRQVAASDANRTNIATAISTGNSGNISLTAPVITLNSGTKLLANAINSGGTTYTGGAITLTASDTASLSYMGYKSASASIQVGDSSGGATVKGASVTMHASATADNSLIIPDADGSGNPLATTVNLATETLASTGKLLELAGVNVIYSQANASATITVKSGSVIQADGAVDLHAETKTGAGSRPLNTLPGNPLVVNNPTALGILYSRIDANSSVQVEKGATITAGSLAVQAHNDAALDASVHAVPSNSGSGSPQVVSVGVGVTEAYVQSTASMAGDANVAGSVQIVATNEGSYSTEVVAKTAGSGNAAGAVAVALRNTSATASLTGNIIDAQSVGVYAVNDIAKDVASSSSKAGTTTLTDVANKIQANVTSAVLQPLYNIVGLGSLKPSQYTQSTDATQTPFRISGAVTYASATDTASATIGGGSTTQTVHATGAVAVGSQVKVSNMQIAAQAEAVSNSSSNPSSSDTSLQSYSAGVAVGNYNRNAQAEIGSNVTVTGSKIGVAANTVMPITDPTDAFDRWTGLDTITSAIESITDPTKVFNGVTSAKSSADGSDGSIGLSGSVGVLTFNNTSQALVDTGAKLNLTGLATGSWSSDSVTYDPGSAAKTIFGVTYKPADPALTLAFNFDKQVDIHATNNNNLLFLAGPILTNSGSEYGLGASISDTTINTKTNAIVREGAVIQGITETSGIGVAGARTWTVGSSGKAQEVQVKASDQDQVISVGVSSGFGATFGLNGTAAVTALNQQSYAWIDDEATVKANNLTVNAVSTPVVWSVAGGINYSKGTSVGIGVAVNTVNADTKAEIADNDTVSTDGNTRTSQLSLSVYNPTTATTGAIISAPVVDVEAHTGGTIEAIAVTAAIASSSDNKGGFLDNIKTTYNDLKSKAASIVNLSQANVTKNGSTPAQPDPPKFGLSGAGSASVNTTGLQNAAVVDGVYVDQTTSGSTTTPSLIVRGTADSDIVAASGAAAVTRAKSSNQSSSSGITGSVAVNMAGNGNSASLSNSTVTGTDSVKVQALSAGDQVAIAVGMNANISKQGTDSGFSANGSVSLTLDQTDSSGNSKNFTKALALNDKVTGASGDTGRVLEVTAYSSTTVGTGGGSLDINTSGSGYGVGAAITYADVRRDISSKVSGSTVSGVDDIKVQAFDSSEIGAGGGMVTATNSSSAQLAGAVVITEISNNTLAGVDSSSSLTSTGSVTVTAQNKGTDSTLESLINSSAPAKSLNYNALASLPSGSNGIVSVAGIVQASKGSNVGVSVEYSKINDNLTAQVLDSTITASTAGAISITANSSAKILGLALGVGVSTNGLSGGGSVAMGEITNTVTASVAQSATGGATTTLTAGTVTVDATDSSTIQTVGGQVNISAGKNAAVGAAVTYNNIANTVSGMVNNADIHAPTAVLVEGHNSSEIDSIAAAGAVASGAAVSGSVTVNFISNTTQGQITNGSSVDANGGSNTNTVTVSASDSSTLQSLAGSLAISGGGSAAAGGAFAYNSIGNTNTAQVSASTLDYADTLGITATENATINTLTAAVAGGQSLSLSGSVSVSQIGSAPSGSDPDATGHKTVASLVNSTVSNGGTTATISASDTSTIHSLAGGVSISVGSAAAGGAVAVDSIHSVASGTISGSTMTSISGLTVRGKNTSVIESAAVSGSGAANGAFAGSAAANTIGNRTLAGVTSSSVTGTTAATLVDAENTGSIEALAGGVGIASSAGVGLAVAVNHIGNETDAYINGSSTGTKYDVGNLKIQSISGGTIRSLAAGVGGAVNVGVAGSTATNYISSNTNAYITGGAVVRAQDNVGVIAQTDDVITNVAGAAGIGLSVAGVGAAVTVNEISGATQAYISGSATQVSGLSKNAADVLTVSDGKLNASVDLAGGLDLGIFGRTDLKAMRETTAVNGVAVNATATHSVENIVANVGGGLYAGVAGTTNVSIITGNTTAYIDSAKINPASLGTASSSQDVSVIAGDHAYSNGFVGTLAVGPLGAGIGIGVDTNVFGNTTRAYIQNSAEVRAADGITVKAESGQGASSLVTSGAGGIVGVVGTGSVGLFQGTTEAFLATNTLVNSTSLTVAADHSSRFFIAAGGVTAGGVALSGAFAVASDASTTTAHIDNSTVSATGAISVAADNISEINNWGVSGALGGGAGIAGSAVVSLVNNTSQAYVTGSHLGSSASTAASVAVTANDTVTIANQAGSLGVGVSGWGVGAGASVVEVGDTTSAYVENSDTHTSGATTVSATAQRNIANTAVTVGIGGTAGISGSAAVTLVGQDLSGPVESSELDKNNSGTLTNVNSFTSASRLIAGQNADTSGGTGVTPGLTASELNQVNSAGTVSVSGRLNPASLNYRTAALVTGTSVLNAGGDITVSASEKDQTSVLAGSLGAGAVGVGGAVAVQNITNNVEASVLNTSQIISTGGNISITASAGRLSSGVTAANVKAYQGSGGIVALGAAVAENDLTNNITARAVRGTVLTASGASNGITVQASDSTDVNSEARGFGAGFAAAGVVIATADKAGAVAATIGDTVASGATTTVTATSTLTVDAERSGQVRAYTLAGVGGVIAGSGSESDATESGSVTARIGNQVTVTAPAAAVEVTAAAEPRVIAEQRGYGGGLLANVGAGFATATANPVVEASITGTGDSITAKTLEVSAANNLNSGANPTASAYAEAVGVGLISVNVNQSLAQSTSQVTATIGANTHLVVSTSTTLSASNTTYETSGVSGVVAGLAAAGAFQADANANSTTTATMGTGVYGSAGSTLAVEALGQDNTYSSATSGSGGLISGVATLANTHNGSATTATLGGGTSANPLNAGSMLLTGSHEAILNSKVDSINAALIGGSGAIANNYTYTAGGSGATGTMVTAQIAPSAYLVTQNFEGLAYNETTKDWLSGSAFNANAGAGGLLSGAAAQSTTVIDDYTHFVFGTGAQLWVTGDRNNPQKTNFSAVNEVVAMDKAKLDSGGAIAIAEAESQILAPNLNADVTLQNNVTLDSVGPVNMGARTGADVQTSASAKTYGLAGAAQGQSTSTINSTNTVNLGSGITIRADGDISLMAGRDSGGTANNLSAVANTDLYNKTAFPINTDPQADATATENNTISIAAGTTVGSVGNINLIADKGTYTASGQGVGKDLYREILAEIGSAFSHLFGGGDVSLDIHAGTSSKTANTAVTVNGQVNAGIQHIQFLDIANGTSLVYTDNPAQANEIVETITIQTGSTEDPAHPGDANYSIPTYSTLKVRRTPGVTYSVGTENLHSDLVTRINALTSLKGQFSSDGNTQTALQAEIDFLQSQLADMFPAGSDQSKVLATVSDVPLITVNNALARSGNINIVADSMTGSGSLDAPGDVKISIINRGQAFLRTNQLIIPEDAGGNIYFNGVSVSSAAGITSRNASSSAKFTGAVTAAASSPVPDITVKNTYVPSSDDALATDVEVVGNISNLRGSLNISSKSGSVNIQSADPSNPLTAPSVAAGTINITAGKNFVFNSPNSWLNVGGDPRAIWGGLRYSNGTIVGGTAGTAENNYQTQVTGSDFSSSSSSVAAERDGSGVIAAGGNIFVSARYVNVNGTLQSGYPDFDATITNSAALTSEIAGYQADYNAKVKAGRPPADPDYQLNNTSGKITAFYNAQTGKIELQPVRSQGGSIQLVGEILNTGGGLIQAMDGYSHITIANTSNYDVVEKGLDTGGSGISGKVTITDFAKQYVVGSYSGPITTTYTRGTDGKVHVKQTAVVNDVAYTVSADAATTSARGAEGTVVYSPDSGERFMWVTGETATTKQSWDNTVVTGGWGFKWSSANYYAGDYSSSSGPVHPILSNGYETFTPSAAQRLAMGSQSNAYQFTGTADNTYYASWNERHDWSSGFLGYYKHHENIHYEVNGEQITNVHMVKGDYNIPVKFIGYDTGAVSVTSSKGIVLAGAITNATGTTTLTAGTNITSLTKDAVVNSQNIIMTAASGIGNGGVSTTAAGFSLTGTTGSLTATTTAGDIKLTGISGAVRINNISTGSGGNVTLSADGNIVQAATGSSAVITGHIISLNSDNGGIGTGTSGTASQYLNVAVTPTSSSDLTAGLSATAQNDIYVRQPGGTALTNNFPLISLVSTAGSITVEAANGTLVNANPIQKPDTRSQAQLLALWNDNQLLAGGGAETSRDNALTSYQNSIDQKYQTYWRQTRGLTAVADTVGTGYHFVAANAYDPNYLVPLSTQEITQLKTLKGWNDAQVATYQQQLTQSFGAGTYSSTYSYAIPTTGSNVIIQNDLTQGYSWTTNQLQPGITGTYFRQTSSTQTVIPDPNIKALNGNVTLKALNGSIGTDTTPVVIQGADLSNPTADQRLALAAAEAVDIQQNNSATSPSVTVLQRRAINVETGATGTVYAQARDHIYLGSQNDFRIKTATANDSIRLKVQGGLYDVATGTAALIGGGTTGVILEAANAGIGSSTNPFRMQLTAGSPLTARAGDDIYISQVTGNLSVASLYTPSTLHITAAQSIFDASDPASPTTMMGNGIFLTATSGSIGTLVNPLKVSSGPTAGMEINASAAATGQDIYLYSPAMVGSTAFPHLKLGQLTAGDEVNINTLSDIVEDGGSKVTANTLTTRSVGGQTLTAGTNAIGTFNANNSGGGNIALTGPGASQLTISGAAQAADGDITVTNAGAIALTGGVSTSLASTVNLQTGGTLTESASGWLNGGNIVTQSVGGQTLNGANTIVKFTATNTGGDIQLTNTAAPLNIAAVTQSAGGDVTVINTGAVNVTGAVSSTGNVALTSTNAAVSESGSGRVDAAKLTTSTKGGQTLNGANTVAIFTATNNTSGDISLTNTAAPLSVSDITQSGGDVTVSNTGAINVTGTLRNTAGTVTLNSAATITETGSGLANVATLNTTSSGGQTLNGANTIGTFNATNLGGDTALTNTAATLTLGSVNQDAGVITVNNTGDISVQRVAVAPGSVRLNASGGIFNGLGTSQSNIDAADIQLTTVGKGIGGADALPTVNYLNVNSGTGGMVTADTGTHAIYVDAVEGDLDLTVLSGNPIFARGKVNIGIARPTGNLVIDSVISREGSIKLKATTGQLTANTLFAPHGITAQSFDNMTIGTADSIDQSFTASKAGATLSIGTTTVSSSGQYFADNILLPNVVHDGSTNFSFTLAGGDTFRRASGLSFTASSTTDGTFEGVAADTATIQVIDHLKMRLNNLDIGTRATISNNSSVVTTDKFARGLLPVDVQLYPDKISWLDFLGPKTINTDAKVVNFRDGYNVNNQPAGVSLVVLAGNLAAVAGQPTNQPGGGPELTGGVGPVGGSLVNTQSLNPPSSQGNLGITTTRSGDGQEQFVIQ